MECVTSDIDLTTNLSPNADLAAQVKEKRIARTKARSQAVKQSAQAAEFASFADQILDELHPSGLLERLMADQVAHSAWRLQASLERKASRDQSGSGGAPSPKRNRPTASEQASRSFRESFEAFEMIRNRLKPARPAMVRFSNPIETEIESNEWPIVPFEEFDDTSLETDSEASQIPDWRDRLIFDFEVSDLSPVVKGTWITVSHVVSLIVDGWTWADILRSHPELTEDDIRICVSYAMDEENANR
jgi:hypothetical protein